MTLDFTRVYTVNWDIDAQDEQELSIQLPTVVQFPDNIEREDYADWLTDQYDFLVNSLTPMAVEQDNDGQVVLYTGVYA